MNINMIYVVCGVVCCLGAVLYYFVWHKQAVTKDTEGYVSHNINTSESSITENMKPSQKIAAPTPIQFDNGDIHLYARNNSQNPSRVMRGNGVDVVFWEQDVEVPVIEKSLERDVQISNYFVSSLQVGDWQGKKVVLVRLRGFPSVEYILDLETGRVEAKLN